MSAPTIQADYDGLKAIASGLAVQADQTFALTRSVGNCLDALRGSWLGKGARQFYAEMDHEVLPAMQRLRAALDEASTAVKRTAVLLEEHERQAGILFFGEGNSVERAGNIAGGALAASLSTASKLFAAPVALPFAAAGILAALVTKPDLAAFLTRAFGEGGKIGIREGGSYLAEKMVEKYLKSNFGSNILKTFSGKLGKVLGGTAYGALSGVLLDLVSGTPITGETIATHMLSGGAKAVVSLVPGGGITLLADAGIQVVGTVGAAFIFENAEALSYNNLARAQEIRKHASAFQGALNNFSLNGVIDKSAAAIVEGVSKGDVMVAAGGIAKAGLEFIGGGVGTLVHGAALAKNIGDSIGEAVRDSAREFGNFISGAAEKVGGFLGLLGIR